MNWHFSDRGPVIDRQTSRSICDGVAETLQQSLRPEASRLSPRLQKSHGRTAKARQLELLQGL